MLFCKLNKTVTFRSNSMRLNMTGSSQIGLYIYTNNILIAFYFIPEFQRLPEVFDFMLLVFARIGILITLGVGLVTQKHICGKVTEPQATSTQVTFFFSSTCLNFRSLCIVLFVKSPNFLSKFVKAALDDIVFSRQKF